MRQPTLSSYTYMNALNVASCDTASYVSYYLSSVYDMGLGMITKVLAFSALGAVVTSMCAGALSKRAGLVLAMTTFHSKPQDQKPPSHYSS